MKIIFLFFFFLLISNCNKPKSVMICGDHICINNKEAKKYFEENLSIEVKIIDDKKRNIEDLVELNLKENSKNDKEIFLKKKNKTKKKIKVLSKTEIDKIKKDIKSYQKKDVKKINKKKDKTNNLENFAKRKKNKIDDIKKKDISIEKDICKILKNCSIEEISEYLIKNSKKKGFPDITLRN